MAEMERFESRFEAALGQLADEVPTAVDAAEVARSVAADGARRGWLSSLLGGGPGLHGLAPVLRFALAPALLLLLVYGLITLAQRIDATPSGVSITGRMTCEGSSWTTLAGPVLLECATDLPDPQLAGRVRIALEEGAPVGGFSARGGTMEIDALGASWSGALEVTVAPNRMAIGDAALTGHGSAGGQVLLVHAISTDGLSWGLLGWIETAR